MGTNCRLLREEALSDGAGSKAELAWRRHAHTCQYCRTEQFILQSLQNQSRRDHQHLRRDEVQSLLEQVRQRRPSRKQRNWTPVFRAAAAWLAVGLLVALYQADRAASGGGAAASPTHAPASALGPAASGNLDQTIPETAVDETLTRGTVLEIQADPVDERMRHLRERIDQQREDIYETMDELMGEEEFHDGAQQHL